MRLRRRRAGGGTRSRARRQHRRNIDVLGGNLPAALAGAEVPLHGVTLGRLEDTHGIEREQVGDLVVAHCGCHGVSIRSARAARNLSRAIRTRPFDRAERHLHRGGDLGLRVAAVVGELDGLALLDRELRERFADLLAAQLERDGRPGVADRRFDRLALHRRVQAGPVSIAAKAIDRPVADDRADPGAQATRGRTGTWSRAAIRRGTTPGRRPRRRPGR